jgi:hypothetical protein
VAVWLAALSGTLTFDDLFGQMNQHFFGLLIGYFVKCPQQPQCEQNPVSRSFVQQQSCCDP